MKMIAGYSKARQDRGSSNKTLEGNRAAV